MNNDNFNTDRDHTKVKGSVERQQFVPGGSTTPPPFRRPGNVEMPRTAPPEMTPGRPQQSPGMEGQPRSAPPDFIPEGPGAPGGQRPGQERTGFGTNRGPGRPGGEERGVSPRELRRCLNRFTYIWLFNGENFWFFPTFVDDRFVIGFRWRRNRWEFDRINIRRIFFSRCY